MDEYVDMSPSGGRSGTGLEMSSFVTASSVADPGRASPPPPLSAAAALSGSPPASAALAALSRSPPANVATTPEGYVEMNYCVRRTQCEPAPSKPISIAADKPWPVTVASTETTHSPTSASPPTVTSPCTPSEGGARSTNFGSRDAITPLGSQTIFPLSLESPATPPRSVVDERQEPEHFDSPYEGVISHSLSTVCEAADEGPTRSPEIGSPPHYVTLMNRGCGTRIASRPIAAPPKLMLRDTGELSCNPTANKTLARPLDAPLSPSSVATVVRAGPAAAPARFSLVDEPSRKSTSPAPPISPKTAGAGSETVQLNYAALDLEPRAASATAAPRTYTQIDFARSEKLNTADAN
ncbi:hypothetical protein EVAR_12714_1 [Eumeta japonica]|uniref:Uncharacterized protein n=1 Tax=Eumeta variegata TaxID=151549 RepID=A0A4C1UNB5_EUMVA|nr:hypothetical protein EVAR_12714_1 [Eumeta japonica]